MLLTKINKYVYPLVLLFSFFIFFSALQPQATEAAVGHDNCWEAYDRDDNDNSNLVLVAFSDYSPDEGLGQFSGKVVCGNDIQDDSIIGLAQWSTGTTLGSVNALGRVYLYNGDYEFEEPLRAYFFEFQTNDGDIWRGSVQKSNGELLGSGDGLDTDTVADPANLVSVMDTSITEGTTDNQIGQAEVDSDEPDDSCEDGIESLGWIVCPVTRVLGNTLNAVTSGVENLLEVPNEYFEDNASGENPIEDTWAAIRNIALAILVPITLVMVVSTALGFEMFSAYTVKKALPRLVVATIFIVLSWEIIVFTVGFVNSLGRGIAGLVTAPLGGFESTHLTSMIDFNGDAWLASFGLVTGAGVVAAGAIGGFGAVFLTLAIFVLFILTVFLLLLLREVLIVSLAIFAPIAILAWIFPANTKIWSLWRASFLKLLLLYPLIMFLIAAGRVVAYVVSDGGAYEGGMSFQRTVLVLIAYIGPFFFIPTAFKFAGGVFANISGMVNNKEKGLFDRGRKLRGGIMKKNLGDTLEGKRWSGSTGFTRGLNRLGQNAGNLSKAGMNPRRMRDRLNTATSSQDQAQIGQVMESTEWATVDGDEELLAAVAGGRGEDNIRASLIDADQRNPAASRRFVDANGNVNNEAALRDATARVEAAQGTGSARAVNAAAVISQAKTSSGYRNAGELMAGAVAAGGGDRQLTTDIFVKATQAAKSSGKIATGGAGYGTSIPILRDVLDSGGQGPDQAQIDRLHRGALEQNGPGQIISAKRGELRTLAPYMMEDIASAVESGDSDAISRELSRVAGRYDVMSQVSPENAEQMAGDVMSQVVTNANGNPISVDPDGQPLTVKQMIDARRGDDEFQNRRREYQSATQADMAQAADPNRNPADPFNN